MAKKIKLPNKLMLYGGIGGGVITVLILVFVFGIGLDFVKPLYEPPTQLTSQQIQENQQIVFEINSITEDVIKSNTGTPEQIQEQINNAIEELNNSVNPTVIPNQTEFSDDPIPIQITDVIIPPSLDLISRVTKIDSTGTKETVEKITKIGSLSLFIDELSKKDYSTGFLEVELILKGKQNLFYKGAGTFNIAINGIPISTTPINLLIDGQGDSPIKFINAIGIQSNIYTFSFADHITKFPEGQITQLVMNSSLQITETQPIQCVTVPCDPIETIFGITDAELFTMDIRRDANLIVITDQQTGKSSVVYPTDSRIILTSIPNNISGISCIIGYRQNGIITGVTSGGPSNCRGGNFVTAGTAPAPSILGIILLDSNGQLVITKPGGSGGEIFNELVTRNANYTLNISSPILAKNLSFGKTQETKSYTCWATGTPNYAVTNSFDGGNNIFYWVLNPVGISIGVTQCNLP